MIPNYVIPRKCATFPDERGFGDFDILFAMNICFETFGCRLNRAETLDDEAKCLARGHRIVDSHSDADMIVVRGCSVTARAQRDCEHLIEHLKQKYPAKRVFITGCLANAKKLDISEPCSQSDDMPRPKAKVPTRTSRAYLKIQDGCSCGCTFCIVPKFRGTPTSIPFTDVLDKAKRFIDAGYHEIVLTGCNLMLYSSEGHRLADLVASLANLSPECRIRLGSVEPGAQAMELVHAMAENGNICRFLHLSIQSGSDTLLKAMRRPYTAKEIDAIAGEATRLMPLIGLGCDLIAGFPDESETDFRLTKGLLVRHCFANVHAFPFSERPGTIAAALPGRILPDVRKRRARELAEMGAESRRKFAKRFIGRTVEVIVENGNPTSGWTGEYLWLEASQAAGAFRYVTTTHESLRKMRIAFKARSAHAGILYGESVSGGR